jgi:hypothetical protein
VKDGRDGRGRGIRVQARLLLNVDKLLHSNGRETYTRHWNAYLSRSVEVRTVSDKDGREGNLRSTSMRTGANPAFSMVCCTSFRVKGRTNGTICENFDDG